MIRLGMRNARISDSSRSEHRMNALSAGLHEGRLLVMSRQAHRL